MSEIVVIVLGIALPWLGTILGASIVLFLGKGMGQSLHKAMLGLASGVMLAASVWSLLLPALDMAENGAAPAWLPAVGGFCAGMVLLMLLDVVATRLERKAMAKGRCAEGRRCAVERETKMLFLAVTLHNLPEGMAVGVVLAGMQSGDLVSAMAALCLAIGIAIQNFPEGAIISVPMATGGMSRAKSFVMGVLSGIVEPVGAIVTLLLTSLITPILPFILAMAAGSMIYVVAQELIPQLHIGAKRQVGMVGLTIGFALMMLLDVVFSA